MVDGALWMVHCGWCIVDGALWMVHCGWYIVDGGWWMVDGVWCMVKRPCPYPYYTVDNEVHSVKCVMCYIVFRVGCRACVGCSVYGSV